MTINNPGIYDSVLAGVAASGGAWINDTNPLRYASDLKAAKIIASEVDQAIPTIVGGPTPSQRQLVESITKSVMTGRAASSTNPSDYTFLAKAVAAEYNEFANGLNDSGNPPPSIVQVNLPSGTVGSPYSQNITVINGQPPFIFSALGLPPGLVIDSTSGTITGTPTIANSAPTVISVADANSLTFSRTYSLIISSYTNKIETLFGNSLVAYWQQNELSGTESFDSSNTGANGTYTNVQLGQPGIGDGQTSALYTATPTSNDELYSAALAAAVNLNEITLLIWGKPSDSSLWNNGQTNLLFRLGNSDASSIVDIVHVGGPYLQVRYGDTIHNVGSAMSGTSWFTSSITVSKFGDVMRGFVNGFQIGVDIHALPSFTGPLSAAQSHIGFPLNTFTWPGYSQHALVLNRMATRWEVYQSANLQVSGTWLPYGAVLEPALPDESTWMQEASVISDQPNPVLIKNVSSVFKIWYGRGLTSSFNLGYAESVDMINFVKSPEPVYNGIIRECVTKIGDLFYLTGVNPLGYMTFISSPTGVDQWTVICANAFTSGPPGSFDDAGLANSTLGKIGNTFYLLYEGVSATPTITASIGLATSTDGGLSWQNQGIVISRGVYAYLGGPFLWQDSAGTFHCWVSRSGPPGGGAVFPVLTRWASNDLRNWTLEADNCFYPNSPEDNWFSPDGQATDVSICESNGRSYMIYTSAASTSDNILSSASANFGLEQLVKTQEGIVQSYNPEMLVNKSFEVIGTGGPDIFFAWTETASDGSIARVTTPGVAYPNSSRIACCTLTAGTNHNTKVSQTVIDLIPGTNYTLTGWSHSSGIVTVINSASTSLIGNANTYSGNGWQQFSFPFIAPADGVVTINCYCPTTPGSTVYFDDLSLKASM
jgi:Putative Ig domain